MRSVIYARISRDVAGEGLGVARQVEDCTAKASALGWSVEHTYVDNDVSASKAVPRPQYEAMLAGIADGTVRAVVVYDLDRLTRKPAELEAFISLAESHNVALANVSGDVDLTTANGKMIARIKGAVARQEADRIAERTKRQKEQRVAQGKPLGQRFRTFGYERDWTVRPSEAEIVREVFTRSINGESQNGITRDLVSRGVKTVDDKAWTALQTSRLLKTHKYAGLQTFKGQVVGKSSVVPALVSEATFEAAQNPTNGASYNFRKYLLSGILICDECKAPMSGFANGDSHRYRCEVRSGGCGRVTIKGSWVDGMIDRYMSNMVAIDFIEGDQAPQTNESAIAVIDERIAALQEAAGTGEIALADLLPALKTARAQRAVLVREDAARTTATYADAITDYDSLTPDAQRTMIKRNISHIFVKPGKRVRYFDETRIYVLMADGSVMPGAAINTVDLRDAEDTGTRTVERTMDADVGF